MQLDVQFWNTCQDASFDVMVFHTIAPSNHSRSLSNAYKKHEDEKKEHMASVYLILNIAQHLLHFILSTSGGMGIRETQTFYKRLADLLSLKCDVTYSTLMGWMIQAVFHHPQICTVMCIRGSRSSTHTSSEIPQTQPSLAERVVCHRNSSLVSLNSPRTIQVSTISKALSLLAAERNNKNAER